MGLFFIHSWLYRNWIYRFGRCFSRSYFYDNGSMMLGEIMRKFDSAFGIIMTILYLQIAALYFFPIYYLNRFSSNLKTALSNNNSETLANSFEYFESHYKFIGIFALIILCFYALVIVFLSIAAVTNGLR